MTLRIINSPPTLDIAQGVQRPMKAFVVSLVLSSTTVMLAAEPAGLPKVSHPADNAPTAEKIAASLRWGGRVVEAVTRAAHRAQAGTNQTSCSCVFIIPVIRWRTST